MSRRRLQSKHITYTVPTCSSSIRLVTSVHCTKWPASLRRLEKYVSCTDNVADAKVVLESPIAGPSRIPLPDPLLDEEDEDADRELCMSPLELD